MKTKLRALADYIFQFGCFPCGDLVAPNGSNAYITRETGRDGVRRWRVRCLECWRASAAAAMAVKRARERKCATTRRVR